MGILREIRRRLEPLLEPAPDPRAAFGDLGERQQQLLARVQQVRAAGAATRGRLEAKIAEARASLDRAVHPPSAGEPGEQPRGDGALRDVVAHELHLLEEELRAFDREESLLPPLERRLRAELDALRVRQDVADARSSTREAQARVREALEGIAGELTELSGAIERAERRSGRLHERAAAINELSGFAAATAAGTSAGASARWLASRFEIEAQDQSMAPLRAELDAGRGAAERLAAEHERLLPALARRASDPMALATVPALVEESYAQGVAALESVLDLVRAARVANAGTTTGSGDTSEETSALRRQAGELIGQAERCGAALERARLELASISASGSAEAVEAVTRTLLAALDRARAVQEQLRADSAGSPDD